MLKSIIIALSIWTIACAAQDAKSNNATRCFRFCGLRHRCPRDGGIIEFVRTLDTNCRKCIMNKCGSHVETNRTEVSMCMFAARPECEECEISNSSLRYHERCQSCQDRCLEGKAFPTIPTSSKRPFGRFPKHMGFVFNRRNTSFCRCESRKMCPTEKEEKQKMMRELPACRQCIEKACGKEAQGDRSNLATCIMRARSECESCKPMDEVDSKRMKNCTKCIRRCRTVTTVLTFSISKQNTCPCESSGTCPSTRGIMQTILRLSEECQACISKECGNITNMEERAECMFMARPQCTDDCKMSAREKGHRDRCSSCKTRCANKPVKTTTTTTTTTHTSTTTTTTREVTPDSVDIPDPETTTLKEIPTTTPPPPTTTETPE